MKKAALIINNHELHSNCLKGRAILLYMYIIYIQSSSIVFHETDFVYHV